MPHGHLRPGSTRGTLGQDWVLSFLLLCAGWVACAAGADVIGSAGAASLLQMEVDPLADRDSFALLPEEQQRTWGRTEMRGLGAKARALRQVEVTVPVAVRLVGFDGHGGGEVDVQPEELSKYLNHLKLEKSVPVIHSPHDSGSHLAMKHTLSFSVQRAPQRIGHEIALAITRFFQSRAEDTVGRNASLVPHSVVDKVIDESVKAHDEAAGGEAYSVYLLNLKPQPTAHAYSYGGGGATAFAAEKGHDFWCPGTSFQAKRYLWVDLNAGPVPYGPQEGEGDGQGGAYIPGVATQASSHNLLKFNPKERPVPLMAHLAAVVSSAVQHLFAPPLLHHPVPLARTTKVHLLHLVGPIRVGDESGDDSGVSLRHMQEEILSRGPSVLLPSQEITFNSERLPLAKCGLCTLALHNSIRTSTHIEEGVGVVHHRFLDALELHHLLTQHWGDLPTTFQRARGWHPQQGTVAAGGGDRSAHAQGNGAVGGEADGGGVEDEPAPGGPAGERLVPVFLFDLPGGEPLLLDGKHQAVAFEDMVIAVRTHSPNLPSPYTCNGAPVMMNPSSVHRPIFGALLQTLWGMTPSQTAWSTVDNSPSPFPSWRWTFGHTPFGPFSSSTSLTLLLRDTALRNTLLSLFNDTISSALLLLTKLQEEYPSEDAVFGLGPGTRWNSDLRDRWDQRWGVLQYKLGKAAQSVSSLDFVAGQFFLLSVRHDVAALYRLATLSASHMETTLECFHEVPLSMSALVLTISSPVACLLVLWSMRRMFQRKEKMF